MDTERAIKRSFLKMLEERPLSQITVKDIVSDCGINRNSFYYHYADLPTLIESIITEETDKIIGGGEDFDSIEDCMDAVISFALDNRRAALHLYNSSSRDIFEHYFMQIADNVIRKYLGKLTQGRVISPEDNEILIHFFKCLLFGQVVDWLRNGMSHDLQNQFRRFCEINRGSIEAMIDRMCDQQ